MDDLISRKTAIDVLHGYFDGMLETDTWSPCDVYGLIEILPSAQPDSKETSYTHKALDTVSRQAVIEAINKIFPADPMRDDYTQGITCGAALANIYVAQLPSAHPEKRTEERTETHACDLISRQAAINALTSHIMPHNNEDGTVTIGVLSKSSIKNILNKLPSAQPDSKETSPTHKALDTISRQAAIDDENTKGAAK